MLLPGGTSVGEVAAAGMSPGLMSAGLGPVPAEQTYLDIGQGNRVFDSLYDADLPRAEGAAGADSAPDRHRPRLLRRSRVGAGGDRAGTACADAGAGGKGDLGVRDASVALGSGAWWSGLRGNDLLIAIERPPPGKNRGLAIGIAGSGYRGNLTSDSTRLDGYVLATDVAPTILERLGVEVPSQMSGEADPGRGRGRPGRGRWRWEIGWR